jgi:hypothetical protein
VNDTFIKTCCKHFELLSGKCKRKLDFSPSHVTQFNISFYSGRNFLWATRTLPWPGREILQKFVPSIALDPPAVPCLGNLTHNSVRKDGYPTRRIARFEIQRSNTPQELNAVFGRLLNAVGGRSIFINVY